jgi:hypothetical protein
MTENYRMHGALIISLIRHPMPGQRKAGHQPRPARDISASGASAMTAIPASAPTAPDTHPSQRGKDA